MEGREGKERGKAREGERERERFEETGGEKNPFSETSLDLPFGNQEPKTLLGSGGSDSVLFPFSANKHLPKLIPFYFKYTSG